MNASEPETSARYLIGIDLGTTNSAMAYVDSAEPGAVVHDFPVPQLVGRGEVEARPTLPSFHYEPAAGEFAPGTLRMPWDPPGAEPRYIVGFFARDHGASSPGRLVVSAKSWLCHSGVDRAAGLLPWHGAADVQRLSPVEVSARYMEHLRRAWDHRFPDHPMAQQDVVLTVPASFDEVARELTVEAARRAGVARVVLLEEPQAAFYAWIDAQGEDWAPGRSEGRKILVCDVGGGTSDFTLIRIRRAKGEKVPFHRVAVGEHLILGGDNLDLALAHHIERKLLGDGKLDPRQWGPLVRQCRQIKETLLGPDAPDTLGVNVAAGGSRLIGGGMRVELTCQEVQAVLVDGFLPRVPFDAQPSTRRSGFQEFALPYAPDPAITRYLAAFLNAHRWSGEVPNEGLGGDEGHSDPARPDMVLFNGGLFESPVLRQRLLESLTRWFAKGGEWSPRVLANDRLDLAVARGAAYYGKVRRGMGVRIKGGLAHSYYVGVEAVGGSKDRDSKYVGGPTAALCLMPAGVEEGQDVDLSARTFNLRIREPVEFPLYASSTRTTDRPGELIEIDQEEQITALPPIRTVLQSGRRAAADVVAVQLHARLTEIGTLEFWCAEVKGDRKWRLQFDVRAAVRSEVDTHEGGAEKQGFVDEAVVGACADLIRRTYRGAATAGAKSPAADAPQGLIKRLEGASAMSRLEWPASLMRTFWEALMEVESGRKLAGTSESRWLNLLGFSLRPGYGLAVDDFRVAQTWRLHAAGPVHARDEQCRAEWWILWRRIAGGLTAGQQQTLAEPLLAGLRNWQRKGAPSKDRNAPFGSGAQELTEVLRTLGSMELLKVSTKLELGELLLGLLNREPASAVMDAAAWAVGRVAARVPVYGPLNEAVEPETAQAWALRMMQLGAQTKAASTPGPATARVFAVVQMMRRTGDRYRDASDAARKQAIGWLQTAAAPAHWVHLVREGGTLEAEEQKAAFGEQLPRGLKIE